MALVAVLFLYTTVHSLASIFGGAAVVAPFHVSICTSTTVGSRLGADLLRAFLEKQGAKNLRVTTDGPLTHVRARLPGRFFDSDIEMRASDSAFAFGSLASGQCNVAVIARSITKPEAARFHKAPVAHLVALDGAVLVVNPANPLRSISDGDVRSIFGGATKDWSRVGGRRGGIQTVLPADPSDAFAVFVEHVLHTQRPQIVSQHTEDVAHFVASPANPGALGLTTFHASDPAKLLLPQGRSGFAIPASTLSIGRRTYPLVMPIYAYHNEATMTPAAYQFLAFLSSSDGQDVVVADGFVSPFVF